MTLDSKYDEMLDYLYGLKWFGIRPGLERIEECMKKLGNPERKLKVIHVAGTNGKGSVCAMLSSILQKSGFRVGMYTSPHLVDFRERFRINNETISKADVMRIAEKIRNTGTELSFFEFSTAIALQCFYEKNVDYAVVEVGMGGRFDATNVVNPVATVITSISLDHIEWLGDTIEKIAYEKAGIAKEGVPMFTAVDSEAIRNACKEKSAPLFIVTGKESTSMNGDFQESNAGIAAAVSRYLKIPEEKIQDGLLSVKWPARLEYIENNVILDCAHNADGIEKISGFIKTLKYDKLVIVFGVMKNKNYNGMISRLPRYDRIILTRPKIERSLDPEELKSICHDYTVIEDAGEAYEEARKIAGEGGLILICGSCYLAGELIAYINKIKVHPIMFVQ
jgi:dihydrofolate synthase/folylpolyglutamate synthase